MLPAGGEKRRGRVLLLWLSPLFSPTFFLATKSSLRDTRATLPQLMRTHDGSTPSWDEQGCHSCWRGPRSSPPPRSPIVNRIHTRGSQHTPGWRKINVGFSAPVFFDKLGPAGLPRSKHTVLRCTMTTFRPFSPSQSPELSRKGSEVLVLCFSTATGGLWLGSPAHFHGITPRRGWYLCMNVPPCRSHTTHEGTAQHSTTRGSH